MGTACAKTQRHETAWPKCVHCVCACVVVVVGELAGHKAGEMGRVRVGHKFGLYLEGSGEK